MKNKLKGLDQYAEQYKVQYVQKKEIKKKISFLMSKHRSMRQQYTLIYEAQILRLIGFFLQRVSIKHVFILFMVNITV